MLLYLGLERNAVKVARYVFRGGVASNGSPLLDSEVNLLLFSLFFYRQLIIGAHLHF